MQKFILLLAILTCLLNTSHVEAASRQSLVIFLDNYGNNVLPGPWLSEKDKKKETPAQRISRVRMIAELTVDEAPKAAKEYGWLWSDADLALAAFTKMWHESRRFDLQVHNGRVRGDRGKSVCLGQIMNGGKRLVGTDKNSTRLCINTVMKHLVTHQRRCLNENTPPSPWAMAKIFTGYGTGWACRENHWVAVKDKKGQPITNVDGSPKKDYWARKRGYVWWQMRSALIEKTSP